MMYKVAVTKIKNNKQSLFTNMCTCTNKEKQKKLNNCYLYSYYVDQFMIKRSNFLKYINSFFLGGGGY